MSPTLYLEKKKKNTRQTFHSIYYDSGFLCSHGNLRRVLPFVNIAGSEKFLNFFHVARKHHYKKKNHMCMLTYLLLRVASSRYIQGKKTGEVWTLVKAQGCTPSLAAHRWLPDPRPSCLPLPRVCGWHSTSVFFAWNQRVALNSNTAFLPRTTIRTIRNKGCIYSLPMLTITYIKTNERSDKIIWSTTFII